MRRASASFRQTGTVKVATRRRKSEVASRLAMLSRFKRVFRKGHAEYTAMNFNRSRFVLIVFVALFALLLGRAYYLATSPFIRAQANLLSANTELSSVGALARQSSRLDQLSSQVEEMSLSDIRALLDETAALARRAARDFQSQYDSWSSLQGNIQEDSRAHDALRLKLDEVKRLQEGEVVRLKAMLDEAQKPSVFADALNLIISFFLGVLGSIAANAIYTAWQARKPRARSAA
jgi:hypothetical protein